MMVLAVLWLPVLIIPYVMTLPSAWAASFAVIDYVV